MPRLVDYSIVVTTAQAAGLRCVYPGGAAFAPTGAAEVVGWGEDEPTIRPQWREALIPVSADDLAGLTRRAWRDLFAADEAWIAPVHHWASELEHSLGPDGQDVRPLLDAIGIDTASLAQRTRADAIAFALDEADEFEAFLAGLLPQLWKSDFTLLLPSAGALATLHHHRQIWWRVSDHSTAARLRELAAS